MGYKRPTPQHLAPKLQAIRETFGVSQYRLSKSSKSDGRAYLEWGRRMPSWFVLIRYAKLAGVPLEFIVDDEIDLAYFKYYLTVVEERRCQLKQRQEPTEQHVMLYRHGPKRD